MSKLFIILLLSISLAQGSRICYKCTGIQCSRTSHNETKICDDSLDVCVTIFEDFNVVESGCSEEISSNLMKKCTETNNNDDEEYDENDENDEILENIKNFDCLKCNENFCNNEGRQEFKCIQCDSNMNPDCKNNPNNITAKSCPKPTSPNSYCFTKYNDDQSIVRGCSVNLKDQRDCLRNNNCMLCLAGDIDNCNVGKFRDTGGSNNTTPIPPHTNTTTPNVTGGSNNTTPIPPHTNTTTPNVTGGSNNTTPIPPHTNTTTPNVTGGGSNNTTPIPPHTNTTTPNVTGGSNNTTPIPPYTNNTTSNVTGGGSNNTTPIPPHTNDTTVLPNNNTTPTITPNPTTPKPTAEPNSANAINFTLSILIVSVILHLFD